MILDSFQSFTESQQTLEVWFLFISCLTFIFPTIFIVPGLVIVSDLRPTDLNFHWEHLHLSVIDSLFSSYYSAESQSCDCSREPSCRKRILIDLLHRSGAVLGTGGGGLWWLVNAFTWILWVSFQLSCSVSFAIPHHFVAMNCHSSVCTFCVLTAKPFWWGQRIGSSRVWGKAISKNGCVGIRLAQEFREYLFCPPLPLSDPISLQPQIRQSVWRWAARGGFLPTCWRLEHVHCLPQTWCRALSHHQQLQQGTLRHCALCHSPELTLRRRQRRKISRCPSLTWVSWIVRHELESPWIRTDVETCGLWSLRPGSERMMKVKCCRLESTSLLSLSSPWAASSSLLRWPAQTHASVACWAMMPVASTSGAKLIAKLLTLWGNDIGLFSIVHWKPTDIGGVISIHFLFDFYFPYNFRSAWISDCKWSQTNRLEFPLRAPSLISDRFPFQ